MKLVKMLGAEKLLCGAVLVAGVCIPLTNLDGVSEMTYTPDKTFGTNSRGVVNVDSNVEVNHLGRVSNFRLRDRW